MQPPEYFHFRLRVSTSPQVNPQKAQAFSRLSVSCFGQDAAMVGEQYWIEDMRGQVVFWASIDRGALREHDVLSTRQLEFPGYVIYNVCLSAQLRGQRLSKIFMQSILSEFRRRHSDAESVYLDVYANDEAAVRLYHSLGFHTIDQVTVTSRRPGEALERVYVMNKSI